MSSFRTVRGMRDFLPEEAKKMRRVMQTAKNLADLYCYEEVITPILEHHDLLAAKSGDEIRERMYAFNDLGGRKVALRPEFTAAIARLVGTKMLSKPRPIRLFCAGSLYRYDEPQFGRFREFWQSNFELIGSERPEADVEVLQLSNDLMRKLGLKNYCFKIGHMGILRGVLGQMGVKEEQQSSIMHSLDKRRWDQALTLAKKAGVSQDGLTTLKDVLETRGKNAHQVLKRTRGYVKDYEDAVLAVENLSEILELFLVSGTEIDVSVETGFARGLDYYTGLIFELYVPEIGIALGGGGRYDKLIELFGGEPTPAVGVAPGVDRLTLAMEKQKVFSEVQRERRVLVISVEEELKSKALEVSSSLREAGIPTEVEVMGRSVSRALSDADRRRFSHVVILGSSEVCEGKLVLRDMERKAQRTVEIKSASKEILNRSI